MAGLDAIAILRSGQCLTTATLASVKEELAEKQRHMEDLIRAHAHLEREIKAAGATIRQHRALLAPVRTLPTDVLLLIFLALEDHSVVAGGPRFIVGQVCRHWRSVSRSSPALWSTLNIVPVPGQTRVDLRGAGVGPRPAVLRTYLSLSLPHPLSIRVESACVASKFMLPIAAHSRRIRHLTLWTHRLGIWRFIADCNGAEFQQLQSLVLWQVDYKDSMPGPDISKQITLPRLQTYMSNLQNPYISLSSSLRTVTAAFFSTTECLGLLSGLGALEVLHITHFTKQELCPTHRIGGLPIRSLRVLKLSPCAICPALNLFTFPNLQELFIVRDSPLPHRSDTGEHQCATDVHPDYYDPLILLLQRSRCSLLFYRDEVSLEIPHIILDCEETLVEMELVRKDANDWDEMTRGLHVKPNTQMFKSLRSLRLVSPPLKTLGMLEDLNEAITSRLSNSGCAKLDLLEVDVPGIGEPRLTKSDVMASALLRNMVDWEASGMKVSFTLERKDLLSSYAARLRALGR